MKQIIGLTFFLCAFCIFGCSKDSTSEDKKNENGQATLSVDAPSQITFNADGTGGMKIITITTNQPSWTYSLNPSNGAGWLSVVQNSNTLKLSASSNESADSRDDVTVTISAANAPHIQITIKQLAGNANLSTNAPSTITFNADGTGGMDFITVTTNRPQWEYTLSPEDGAGWLTVTKSGDKLHLNATINSSATPREEVILTISADKAPDVQISMQQLGAEPVLLTGAPSEIIFNADGTGGYNNGYIDVLTNYPSWTYSLNPSDGAGWLSVTQVTEEAEGKYIGLYLKATPYATSDGKDVLITISAGDAPDIRITVKKLQSYDTLEPPLLTDEEGEYYAISSLNHLIWLSEQIAAKTWLYSSGLRFVQTADIDMNNYGFTPIGTEISPFRFNYDGQGFKIYNLRIFQPGSNYVGLFGYVRSDNNIKISNVHIASGTITGNSNVGGIVGYFNQWISKESTIIGCCNEASVTGGIYVGGITGTNQLKVIACVNTGNITGGSNCGGITGVNDAYSEYVTGEVTACYNTGNIKADANAGGIAGVTKVYWDNEYFSYPSKIISCYNTGTISCNKTYGGGLVGNHSGTASGYNIGKVTGPYAGMMAGYLYDSGGTGFYAYRAELNGHWLRYDDSDVAIRSGTDPYQKCHPFSASDWPSYTHPNWQSSGHWVEGGTPNGINSEFPKLYFEE